jgi:hypothetical protein
MSPGDCRRKLNSSICNPTINYPIFEMGNGTFQVYPTTVTNVTMEYIKKGNTPKVVLKEQNGIVVYDSANSVEPTWGDRKKIDILRLILEYLNVPMSNENLTSLVESKISAEK